MKFLRLMLLLLSCSAYATDWTYRVGSEKQLRGILEANLGDSRLFNCNLRIEKIPFEMHDTYLITVEDVFADSQAAINLDLPKKGIFTTGLVKISHVFKEKVVRSLQVYQNNNQQIHELIFREIDFNTMSFYTNIKCSSKGRSW
jgi:hypothetical protein